MKKVSQMLLAALMLVSLSCAYGADDAVAYCNTRNDSSKSECNRCQSTPCCCECVPSPSCPVPTECAFNAPYRDGTCWDVFATASFTYWNLSEDGLALAQTASVSTSNSEFPSSDNVGKSFSIVDFDSAWHPGFKVGLGMKFDCDYWEIYAQYTWFHNTTNTSVQATGAVYNKYFLFVVEEDRDVYDAAKSSLQIGFDRLDVELARPYYVGCKLVFRPFVGLRALWLDQTYNVAFQVATGSAGSDSEENYVNDVTLDLSSDSWAIGARIGFDTKWMFCSGFFFGSSFSTSLLYTDFTSINAAIQDVSVVNGEVTTYSGSPCCAIRPNTDLTLGLGWADYVDCDCKWFMSLFAGYEFNYLWGQNQFLAPFISAAGGDLYTQGLTLTLRLDF